MSIKRILAIIYQEIFITMHSMESINDIFLIAVINFLLFGFLSTYLVGSRNPIVAQYLLLGMVLWEIIRIVQYSISVHTMWNIWSRNLSNLFVSPLSEVEFFAASTISAVIKGLLVTFLASIAAIFIFHFNIYKIGIPNLLLYALNLILFAFATGLVIVGCVFKFGTKIQALSWSVIPILQPLTANFYPLSILPNWIQKIALCIPVTYVFEGARRNLIDPTIQWNNILIALLENIIYITLAVILFRWFAKSSKTTGQFARNES